MIFGGRYKRRQVFGSCGLVRGRHFDAVERRSHVIKRYLEEDIREGRYLEAWSGEGRYLEAVDWLGGRYLDALARRRQMCDGYL